MTSSVLSIIKQLSSTSSRKEKEDIINQNIENTYLKKCFQLVLDPYVNFFITKVPQSLPDNVSPQDLNTDLDVTEEVIIDFIYSEVYGNINRASLKEGIACLNYLCNNEDVRIFLNMVIAKDLNCGVAASTVNKVWNDLIPVYKVMKAEEKKHLSNITYPAIIDEKIDAARCTAYITPDGEIELKSSSGRVFLSLELIKNELSSFFEKIKDSYYDGCIVDGEIAAFDEKGVFIGRQKSNGLALKAQLGTISPEEEKMLRLVCFDLLSSSTQLERGFDPRPLIDRRQKMIKLFGFDHLEMVDSQYVDSEEEAIAFFNQIVKSGGEGAVVKNAQSPYESKRSKNWVKLKKEYEADVEIIDVKPHKKKEGMVGSIKIRTSDGKVIGDVGSKMTYKVRKELWDRHLNGTLIGSIAAIVFMELTEENGQLSFYLPRYIEIRFDKDEADDLEKIESMM